MPDLKAGPRKSVSLLLAAGVFLAVALVAGARFAQPPAEEPPKGPPADGKFDRVPFRVVPDVLVTPITREGVQKVMASGGSDPALKMTRIDRVYFSYKDELGPLKLR